MLHRHLRSTLFPYTTLFRSLDWVTINAAEIYVVRSFESICVGMDVHPNIPGNEVIHTSTNCELCFVLTTSAPRSEEHTSELQSLRHLVCRLLLEKKNPTT